MLPAGAPLLQFNSRLYHLLSVTVQALRSFHDTIESGEPQAVHTNKYLAGFAQHIC